MVDPGTRRQIIERLRKELLPWNATAGDRQEALEAGRKEMAELGENASEPQLTAVAREAIAAVADKMRQRQARETRKGPRVKVCVAHIRSYVLELVARGEVDSDALQDYDWIEGLERKARRRAEAELTGAEEPRETDDDARALAEEVVEEGLREEDSGDED